MKTTENTICLLERYTRYEAHNIQIVNPCYTHTYYKDHGVEVGNLSVNCHQTFKCYAFFLQNFILLNEKNLLTTYM